jgi:hypothetical protein
LPARLLQAVHRVEALAPQQSGKDHDLERAARWNARGFFLLDLGFYTATGLALGALARAAAGLRR